MMKRQLRNILLLTLMLAVPSWGAAKTLTFTGGTGCTAVTPKFTFSSGTVTASVNDTPVHTFTSGVEANIALTVGQTLTYDFTDWDAVTQIDINGDKISGALSAADLPTGMTLLYCYNCTLMTGDMSAADLPTGMTYLSCYNCTLMTGDMSAADLPTRMTYLSCYNCTLMTGDMSAADLPTGMTYLYCAGCTQMTGDMSAADLPTGMTLLSCSNCTLLTGDMSGGTSFAGLKYLYVNGTECTYGTGQSLRYCNSSLVKIDFDDCRMTWPEVNRVLADLVASGVTGKALDIAGTTFGPTTAGAADAATLVSRSWTISRNVLRPVEDPMRRGCKLMTGGMQ